MTHKSLHLVRSAEPIAIVAPSAPVFENVTAPAPDLSLQAARTMLDWERDNYGEYRR